MGKRSIKGVRTILGWLQNEPKNAEPIKHVVRRHHNKLIQDSHKRPCQKKKTKNNEFRNYVTGMTEWLHKNPKNEKPIEQVEQQRKENFRQKPWNKKKKRKINTTEEDPTQRIIYKYLNLH